MRRLRSFASDARGIHRKLFSLLRAGIPREQVRKDVTSGIIVGILALPLAIAFAIASGVPPDKGLITAVVAGIMVSAFGESRVEICWPTGAFIMIVYGIVQQHGLDGSIIATFMAGVLLVAMGCSVRSVAQVLSPHAHCRLHGGHCQQLHSCGKSIFTHHSNRHWNTVLNALRL